MPLRVGAVCYVELLARYCSLSASYVRAAVLTQIHQVRYSRLLEEGDFRGRTGDFVWFLLFCSSLMIAAAPFLAMNFLGRPLAFMMVYVWGRWVLGPTPRVYI